MPALVAALAQPTPRGRRGRRSKNTDAAIGGELGQAHAWFAALHRGDVVKAKGIETDNYEQQVIPLSVRLISYV